LVAGAPADGDLDQGHDLNRHVEAPSALPARHRLNVLVAEDNAVNQTLAVRMLERLGHTASIVGNGREAIDALERGAFDLVLMDLQMPEMDGFAATAVIRERERLNGAHVIVVALTAHAVDGARERCMAARMDGYLTKPLRADDLARELDRVAANLGSGAPPTEPPMDVTTAMRQASDDPELLAELAGIFINDAEARIQAIRDALAAADARAVERAAHTLKGGLVVFAANRSAGIARKLEMLAHDGHLPESAALLDTLEREVQTVTTYLQSAPWSPAGKAAS
jgi:two-component system, sensor histidine kinase and response regulator